MKSLIKELKEKFDEKIKTISKEFFKSLDKNFRKNAR